MGCRVQVVLTIAIRVAVLLVIAAGASAQEQDPEQMLRQMLADARDLAGRNLPRRDRLPGWKVAWELPRELIGAVASEDEYWQRTMQTMGFAGVGEAHARKMIDQLAQQVAAEGGAEGLSARDGVISLLLRVQSTDAPSAVKFLNGWEASAALMRQADTLNPVGNAKSDAEKSRAANRAILDAFAAPYAKLGDEDLKALCARQTSLIKKRTQMSYFRSNDWPALVGAKSDEDLVKRGVWLGVVKVNVMIADREKLADPLDLTPEQGPALRARLNRAVRTVTGAALARKRKEIEARAAGANDAQQAQIEDERKKLAAEEAAAKQMTVTVEHDKVKNLGDNCYFVRITGVSPETSGLEVGLYSGWLRRGEAMAEVTIGGNFPLEEMDREMAHFLAEMDAALMDYDSSIAGALMIVAPADPDPPGGGTTGSGSPGGKTGPEVGGSDRMPPPGGGSGPIGPPPDDPVELAQGMAAYNDRDFAGAQRQFDAALRQSPNNPRVLLMRGAARFYQNDLAGAKDDYARAAALDPNNAALRRYWAFLELCVGDAAIAAREADLAIALAPADADAYLTRAQAAMAQGRPDDAQQWFRAALDKAPNRTQTLYDEAGVALGNKLWLPAALQFQTVLWLDPSARQAWYGRGAALAGAGQFKAAIAAFESYLEYDGTSTFAAQARSEIARLTDLAK